MPSPSVVPSPWRSKGRARPLGDSAGVFEPKLAALEKSGARTLVTANPGCQLQWESGLARAGVDVKVAHVVEVLARACDA